MLSTGKQTNRQTKATKNITSFAKVVIITVNEVINRKKYRALEKGYFNSYWPGSYCALSTVSH